MNPSRGLGSYFIEQITTQPNSTQIICSGVILQIMLRSNIQGYAPGSNTPGYAPEQYSNHFNSEPSDDDGFCGFSDNDDEGYYYDLNTGETYTKSDRSICAF
ncbi:14050_t:CDS:2 [Ambispora leptoticha]|uniref:14050_t:CDS:1 n=1 Tax=Ambispora leptoticha TaxID=144679 RepID=A0A9N8W7J3_9GLOM|nr:14050_t:CDS:2 [Ambispora leptoticha]